MAHVLPYDRQSSHLIFTVTEALYIWVTKSPPLSMEPASPYEGKPVTPLFCNPKHYPDYV